MLTLHIVLPCLLKILLIVGKKQLECECPGYYFGCMDKIPLAGCLAVKEISLSAHPGVTAEHHLSWDRFP